MKSEKKIVKKVIELAQELGSRTAYLEMQQRIPISAENEKEHNEKIKNMREAINNVRFILNTIIDTVFK